MDTIKLTTKILLFVVTSYFASNMELAADTKSNSEKASSNNVHNTVISNSNNHFNHTVWGTILKKNITVSGHASTVNYKAIKAVPQELNMYLSSVSALSKADFDKYSQNEKLAFLINAYNAFTVKLIVDHYPVKSIKDIGSFLTNSWKIKFFNLFGEKRYLDNIEHDMVRKWFNEPRIHFALVCASIGCPALSNEAYEAEKLDSQLEYAAKNFLMDSTRNRFDPAKKKLELSSIFDWYGDDFIKKFGSVQAFVATRITDVASDQELIKNKKVSLSFLSYNWSLNETK